MAKVSFAEVINASLEWSGAVLFRPFRVKKWLILAFVALMAGYISSCNSNISGNGKKKAEAAETASIKPAVEQAQKQTANPVTSVLLVTAIILFALSILILIIWLCARFYFIFLENVVRNDASIKIPFKSNRELGNSIFIFYLIMALTFLVLAGLLIFLFTQAKNLIFTLVAFGLPFLIIFIAMVVVSIVVRDFVVVVMFKDRVNFASAFKKSLAIISPDKGLFLKYLLVLIGLGIASGFASMLIALAALVGLFFPAAIFAGLSYLASLLLPVAARKICFITLFASAAAPVMYFFICLQLPFAIFFRTLSLKFIARLAPEYNLFDLKREVAQ